MDIARVSMCVCLWVHILVDSTYTTVNCHESIFNYRLNVNVNVTVICFRYMLRWDKLGESHDDTLKAMLNLAKLYQRRKKWLDGEKTFNKYVLLVKGKFGASSSEVQAAEKAYSDFKIERSLDSPAGGGCCVIS